MKLNLLEILTFALVPIDTDCPWQLPWPSWKIRKLEVLFVVYRWQHWWGERTEATYKRNVFRHKHDADLHCFWSGDCAYQAPRTCITFVTEFRLIPARTIRHTDQNVTSCIYIDFWSCLWSKLIRKGMLEKWDWFWAVKTGIIIVCFSPFTEIQGNGSLSSLSKLSRAGSSWSFSASRSIMHNAASNSVINSLNQPSRQDCPDILFHKIISARMGSVFRWADMSYLHVADYWRIGNDTEPVRSIVQEILECLEGQRDMAGGNGRD